MFNPITTIIGTDDVEILTGGPVVITAPFVATTGVPSGPKQPMSNIAQGSLRSMRDEVLSWNPEFPPYLADSSLNNKMREVLDRRMWAGLLVKDQLVVPDAYKDGSVSTTRGTNVVIGTNTTWPTNDGLNTTLTSAVQTQDLRRVITAPVNSTTVGTQVGDWVTVDGGTASEEQVLVTALEDLKISGIFVNAHAAGARVWRSSLVRLQFITGVSAPWYTVKGVSSPTRLVLDQSYGWTSAANTTYQICMAYAAFGSGSKMILSVLNLYRRYRLKLHMPQEAISMYDPQRSATESTFILADYVPDEVGRPRYELYPRPTSAQVFPYIAYQQPANLVNDYDTPPPFVRTDVIVKGALADALRWRGGTTNKYYDLQTAQVKMVEFEKGIIEMALADDSVYVQNLIWETNRFPFSGFGADFRQSHDVGIMAGDF